MLITGLSAVDHVLRRHPDVRAAMLRWVAIAESCEWRNVIETRRVFPTADLIKGTKLTCFNLGGNKFRLIAIVSYATQTVSIVELLTHAEYDRKY